MMKTLDVQQHILTGQWKDDKAHGIGRYFSLDGDWYEGQWVSNMQQGKGTYYYRNGSGLYKGQWCHIFFD